MSNMSGRYGCIGACSSPEQPPFRQGESMALTQIRCADCGGKNVDGYRTYAIKDGEQRTMYHCASCGCSFSETKHTPLAHLRTPEVITIYDILCLSQQEASPMAHVQFADLQARPTAFLDFTSVTLDEFQQLVPPFEAAFQAHMAAWRLDGKPRTARRFSVYQNCPLPTPEERLLFILAYVKTYSLQVVQGRLFGMGQSKANQWIHVLLPVLLAALRTLGDAPARSLTALAQRLGVSEADAAAVVEAREAEPAPVATPEAPLLPMTGPNDALSAPTTLLHRKRVIAARKKTYSFALFADLTMG